MRRNYCLSLGMGFALLLFAGRAPGAQPYLQEPHGHPPGREAGEQGERAFGSITSVGVDRFEIKKLDGTTLAVLVDEQTRFRQADQEIQLEDLKAGDRVMVHARPGEEKEFVARVVRRITDEEAARFERGGNNAFGEIVSIDKNQLKIRNPYQGEKTVMVDDQTTFMKEGQSITLKDFKVGDRIVAIGKEVNGQFVATRVMTRQFPSQRGDKPDQRKHEDGPERH